MKILDVPRSGSYQGVTSSRNRFGQYVRTRATPVNPSSTFQGVVRARLSANAANWRGLTDLQREGWVGLGASMSRTDSLGQVYTLTGFQAYCSVNNNLAAAGDALVSDAPALVTPPAILTAVAAVTDATATITFTPDPLTDDRRLFVYASEQRSAGRAFEGDYRLLQVGAENTDSPLNIFAAYSARFGTPVSSNKIFFSLHTYEAGFLSGPMLCSDIVA